MARIVIVSGTESGRMLVEALAGGSGHEVIEVGAIEQAGDADVVFVEPAKFVADAAGDAAVVVLVTSDTIGEAVEAVRGGAYGLLRLPCTPDEVRVAADGALRLRQLLRENVILRGRVTADGQPIGTDPLAPAKELAGKPLADIEKQVILSTLEQFKGHRLRTAAALGIGVRTLGMKIKRWRDEGESIAGRQPRPPVHFNVM